MQANSSAASASADHCTGRLYRNDTSSIINMQHGFKVPPSR
jgi:hypothetical protein